MLNYKPLLDTNGEVKPIFNPDDFNKQYASISYADLLDYANLYSSNNFLGSNSFIDIFVTSINNIAEQTLNYISTLRSDAQEQIDSKRNIGDNLFIGPIFSDSLKISTEQYVDDKLATKRNIDDNIFIGDVFTVDENTIQNKLTTEIYVDTKVTESINNLLNGAGPAYDTLLELQNNLINNDTEINTLINQIALKAPISNPTFTGTVRGITKAMVGLSSVNNTSDINKPISTATQNALTLKANLDYVDTELIKKSDIIYVDSINNNLTTEINTKSNLLYVDTELNKKATIISVNDINTDLQNQINTKANIIDPIFSNKITVNNNATFNKGIIITETSPNTNISLRSSVRNSQLNFISGANVGNYNPITSTSDNIIVYHNGSTDTGTLNIMNWSNSQNGIKLTKQLTKVYNNFEVTNGSFVGSPIFRPTGNSAFGLGNNIYNTTALSSPLIYNGIANGTGNNASYTDFNVSFNSYYGTGFVCTSNNTCNAYLDHTNGNFTTKGNLTMKELYVSNNTFLSGNLLMANNDITTKDISARSMNLTGNINMPNNSISARELYLSANLNMSLSDIYVRQIFLNGQINMQKNNINNASIINSDNNITIEQQIIGQNAVTRIVNDSGIAYIQSGSEMVGASKTKLRFTPIYSSDSTMTIDHINKRVGICNDNPTNALTVGGNSNIIGSLQCSSNITQNNLLLQGDSTNGYIRTTNNNSTLYMGANNQNLMSINTVGLSVIGQIETTGNIYAPNMFVNNRDINNELNNNITYSDSILRDVMQPTSYGVTNIHVFSCTVSKCTSKLVEIEVPLSHQRNFRLNVTNQTGKIIEVRNSMTCNIYRNGILWKSNHPLATDLPMPYSQIVSISAMPQTLSDTSYEINIGNYSVIFPSDYVLYDVTYDIYFSYAGSVYTDYVGNTMVTLLSNSGIRSNGTVNTIVTKTLNLVSSYTPVSPSYKFPSYTFSKVVYILPNNNATSQTNNFIANDIKTDSLSVVNGIKINNGLAGYHIDGASNFLSTPIFCSMKSFGRANTDNYWFLNAGFKIEIYNSNDYISWIKTMDNTEGNTGVLFSLVDIERDRTESFKVYYLGNLISFSPIS